MESPSFKKIILRVLAFIIYVLIGGAIFQLLEKANQKKLKDSYENLLHEFMCKYNISRADVDFLEHLIIHNGKESFSTNWSYANAAFFAGTTLLTVGYGNITPKTTGGQAFCILFAILGIPIACLALKSLGERITATQVSFIDSVDKYLLGERRHRPHSIHLKATILNFILTVTAILLLAGMAKLKRAEWTYFECIYFVVITFTTIGFGDYLPIYNDSFTEFDMLSIILGFFIGFTLVSSLLCSVSNMLEEHSKKVIRKARHTIKQHKTKRIATCRGDHTYSLDTDISEEGNEGTQGSFWSTGSEVRSAEQVVPQNKRNINEGKPAGNAILGRKVTIMSNVKEGKKERAVTK